MQGIGKKSTRIQTARETLSIFEQGYYLNGRGETVDVSGMIRAAKQGSVLYRPGDLDVLVNRIQGTLSSQAAQASRYEVTGETANEAILRLVVDEGVTETAYLNFASAKNPGGGFLNGSVAQEESLAISSGLYPCIAPIRELYDYNRGRRTCLYSDHIIFSPQVPFIRTDDGMLLDRPVCTSIITAPAVNAGVVREREPESIGLIDQVMTARIRKVLAVASLHKMKAVILGAYGCGVFRNRAEDVAGYFQQVLIKEHFQELFERIVFAVYETSPEKEKQRAFLRFF